MSKYKPTITVTDENLNTLECKVWDMDIHELMQVFLTSAIHLWYYYNSIREWFKEMSETLNSPE